MAPPAAMPFVFEGAEVRVVMRDGAPWFVLADVCRVLEIAEAHRAASRLDDDEKGRHTMTTPGGPQEMAVINESGLYSLTMTSRKEGARRFKKWVTGEVLPSIRRDGGYMLARPEETAEELAPESKRPRKWKPRPVRAGFRNIHSWYSTAPLPASQVPFSDPQGAPHG